jgi:adenylosuccinate synthase
VKVDVILGLQWGDEGKGKIVDYLAGNYDIVARFQGGPNAGHTIIIGEQKFVLHIMPSGIFRDHITNLIGNGVVIDPVILMKEIRGLEESGIRVKDKLLISKKAHLILPTHRWIDAASEASKGKLKIGSTLKGIGPSYMDKTGRNGLRIGDILLPDFKEKYQQLKEKHLNFLGQFNEIPDFDIEKEEKKWMENIRILAGYPLVSSEYYINKALDEGKRVLAEGAQGTMLDIDHGTYPFVTSSNTISAGVNTGLGIAPSRIGEIIGITKAYTTRVGSGPFPTELFDEDGEQLRAVGHEFGATTGRSRRCGWLDIPQVKYSIMVNGVTQLALTKLDVLNAFSDIKYAEYYHYDGKVTDELPFCLDNTEIKIDFKSVKGWKSELSGAKNREELPQAAKAYLDLLEEKLGVPITFISIGPEREELIVGS